MDELISQLEQLKADLAAQAIQALQNDLDIGVHVLISLPKVRNLLNSLKQAKAQMQNQG